MFLFPLIYILSFFDSIRKVIAGKPEAILLFIIAGLSIYTTSLSIMLQLGLGGAIPFIQPLKEVAVLLSLGIGMYYFKGRMVYTLMDYAIIVYLVYSALYIVLPIGGSPIGLKILAFKSSNFFVLVYLAGRLVSSKAFYLSKYFNYILLYSIFAFLVLGYELLNNQHFQSLTGYADYNFRFFNQDPQGNYDLSWTFESLNGVKRFSSFFANPLEFAASTLISISVLLGLYTTSKNRLSLDKFGIVALIAIQLSIFLAISRASMLSYFIIIYCYAVITKKYTLLKYIHLGLLSIVLYVAYFLFAVHRDLYDYIIATISFTEGSSVGHVLAWIEGVESIAANPLGVGLAQSGIQAISTGSAIGGENQLIIIGVQTGIVSLALYGFFHIYLIMMCWKWYPRLQGKERKLCLALFLMKIGFIIPLLTSELESSVYISYLNWFFSGLFVGIVSRRSFTTRAIQTSALKTSIV